MVEGCNKKLTLLKLAHGCNAIATMRHYLCNIVRVSEYPLISKA